MNAASWGAWRAVSLSNGEPAFLRTAARGSSRWSSTSGTNPNPRSWLALPYRFESDPDPLVLCVDPCDELVRPF
jgi:hypothetical protein